MRGFVQEMLGRDLIDCPITVASGAGSSIRSWAAMPATIG